MAREADGQPAEVGHNGPLYQMVVAALRAEIIRGVYPVGTRLPSESSLVARFAVSRHTVREALRQLRDLGLVESRQGLGTVVLRPGGEQVYVHKVNSIADLHDSNVESRYDEDARLITADSALAIRLGCQPGDAWLRVDGTRYLDLEAPPVCVVEIYVPRRFAGVSRLLGRRSGPIYSLIELVYGENIVEVEQELRALPPPAAVARLLEVAEQEIAIEIRRVYRLLNGEPAEITFNYYKASQFRYSMNLRRVREPFEPSRGTPELPKSA